MLEDVWCDVECLIGWMIEWNYSCITWTFMYFGICFVQPHETCYSILNIRSVMWAQPSVGRCVMCNWTIDHGNQITAVLNLKVSEHDTAHTNETYYIATGLWCGCYWLTKTCNHTHLHFLWNVRSMQDHCIKDITSDYQYFTLLLGIIHYSSMSDRCQRQIVWS